MPEPSPPPTAERRLAAILAADVVGYSRLMGEDEAGTVARLKAVRLTLIEPLVAEHRGRIVKLMGDGVLCEFASVVAAVACAVALQRAMAKAEPDEPEDRRIRFRIGINLGDIIIEDGDIYGDGVNIAARLEQLAEPGGICVSDKVRTEVGHKLDFGFADAGRQRVKNIAEPIGTWRVVIDGRAPPPRRAPPPPRLRRWRPAAIVAALLLALVATGSGGWWWWQREGRDEAAPFGDRISVVVLPFDNLSGDERLGRLADGMVVDIIEGLSVSRELAVIAPGTSFAYRDRTHDARQIGQELGVTYVVDGSLQGDGDRLRATVQLVDAATSTQVWAERYDRPLDDLFAVQEELTQRIASTLTGGVIARAAADAARRKPTKSLQAYDLLLLAQQERSRWTREGNARALELARQAIALEPRLAPAYVQLGLVYLQQLDLGLAASVDEALEGWLEAARKAVELDPTDARARVVLYKRYLYGGDFSRAVPELERALELAPGNAGILGDIAIDLPWLGQSERAVQLGERAKLLDPSTAHDGVLTAAYFFTGRFAEAAATVDAMEQPDRWSQLYAVLSYAQLDRAAELERWRARLRESWPDYSNERSVAETSDFAPAAAAERDLWVESHAKAGLPLCATAEQLAADPAMRRLPECDAERAKAGGS
jgi:class 3 adenylate cyclase/TolB-like protein